MMKLNQLVVACAACLGASLSANAALVSHYALEEGASNPSATQTLDDARSVNDPINGSGVTWISSGLAPINTTAALDFSGGDFSVESSFVGVGGSQDRTVAFWVRSDPGAVANAAIVAWGDDSPNGQKWHVRLNDSAGNGTVGAIRTEIQGSFIIGDVAINDGEWHHVASVLQGDSMHDVLTYIDGVLVGVSGQGSDLAINTDIVTPDSNVLIGSRFQGGNQGFFDGAVDEVFIFDNALSSAEIARLAATIPEPASAMLLGVAGAALMRRRRTA